ncbi:sulfotransferase family protein [Lewinellaceae bacterium SD302]|nr:sulfotransferase family protein [Lewinellaceae bacterium SD302]
MHNFKTKRRSRPQKLWDFVRSVQGIAQSSDFSRVTTHLQFLAPPRSGNTLVGSLLDAHPEMVIAHEMDSMHYFQAAYQRSQIDYLLLDNSRKFTEEGRQWMGYNYQVPGQWQGKYRQLKVLGDKSGGRSARRILHAKNFEPLRDMIAKLGDRELVFLHIIRNPYDNITTMMKRTNKRKGKTEQPENLLKKIDHFFQHSAGIQKLYDLGEYRIISVHHEVLVSDTANELRRICNALGLEASQEYLDACAGVVWAKPKKTRHGSDLWSAEMIDLVSREMQSFPWFERYSY